MTFTTDIFIIGLFPIFVILYQCLGRHHQAIRKLLFIAANSLFLVWGGAGSFLLLCIFSFLVYLLTLLVNKFRNRTTLSISVFITAVPLVILKYTVFIINMINSMTGSETAAPAFIVPTGISFITFEAISLLADTFSGKIDKAPGLINTFLYLTFFPTVTSGPILRYGDFQSGLYNSAISPDYNTAIERIAIGMCKKLLVADKIAVLADYYFDGTAMGNRYSILGLWLGSIAYTLQLYFDFSGYSDMAIGIGQLLGFKIRKNFNKPYQAYSISDFWNRWHISLTSWFRDYIYIPLGGNRCSRNRHIMNMLVVWLVTGLWHGADWTFIIWGLGYFILLTAEKYHPVKWIRRGSLLSHLYTLFFVNLLWVPFRAKNLSTAALYIRGMFGGGSGRIEEKALHFLPFLILTVLLCLPWKKWFSGLSRKKWFNFLRGAVLIILVCWAICALINSSYAPYIYGNF